MSKHKSVEIQVQFLEEYRRRDDWASGRAIIVDAMASSLHAGEEISISGVGELEVGIEYRLTGQVSYWHGRPQFKFTSHVESQPVSDDAILSYLTKYGEGCGVGPSTAIKIQESLGAKCIELIRDDPSVLHEWIDEDQADMLAARLRVNARRETTIIEVESLLKGRGFRRETAGLVIEDHGVRSVERIKKDAFILMKYPGAGFARCDKLFCDLRGRGSERRLRRLAHLINYTIKEMDDGSTWYDASAVLTQVSHSAGVGVDRIKRAYKYAIRAKLIESIRVSSDGVIAQDGALRIAVARHARNERDVAESFCLLNDTDTRWPKYISGVSNHQQDVIARSLRSRIGLLTGSGGTGKTFCESSLYRELVKSVSPKSILLAAPTGKAACRISELLSVETKVKAVTIHKALCWNGSGFGYDDFNKLPHSFIIVDEFSMVPTDLLAALLRATPDDAHVLFVGDVAQLPPVGHGAPLRDLMRAGISAGELTEIRRNSGAIVEVCHAIRHGREWEPHGNLRVSGAKIADVIKAVVKAGSDCDPIWDVQAITASNSKGPLSKNELNKALQEVLNPKSKFNGAWKFKVNDKVVNTSNGWIKCLEAEHGELNSKNEAYVANGELGRVKDLADKYADIEFTEPYRLIRITKATDSVELAYALTAHKCQGSEWQKTVVAVDQSLRGSRLHDRSWIYTAFSRAKIQCDVVGSIHYIREAALRESINSRFTLLVESIRMLQAQQMALEL